MVEVTNTSAVDHDRHRADREDRRSQSRDFRNLVLLTPQTRFDSERGNLSISGQRGINTNVTVDGVDFNNAFFGGTVGGAEGRAPLSISQESIKEFSVITNGASVEFGRSGGGFVNVVTKSGTQQPARLGLLLQPAAELDLRLRRRRRAGRPGEGPVRRLDSAAGSSPTSCSTSSPTTSRTKSETVPIDSRVLDAGVFARYPELASASTYVQSQDGDVLFGRVDFQATPEHRFMLRANFTDYTGVNGTSNATTRTDSYNGIEGLDTKAYVGSWSGQFGDNILNDLNINYITEDTPREDKGLDLPDFQVARPRLYGEVAFLPIVSTTERKAIGDTVTWLTGDHVLKFGGEYNDTSIDQIFKGNWRGVFRFNSRADFLAGEWASYNQFGGLGGLTADQAGHGRLRPEGDRALRPGPVVPELEPDALGRRPLREPGQPERSDPEPERPQSQRLAPPDGARFRTPTSPTRSRRASASPGRPATTEDGDPRFSAGRFWSRTPAILLAQLFTSNGLRGTQYQINAPPTGGGRRGPPTDPLSPGWGANFTVPGTERIDFTARADSGSPRASSPSTRTSRTRTPTAYTLGCEREIMRLHGGRHRPHLRRGQAAAAPDRHQPAVHRHDTAPTACRATRAPGRTPTTAASRPASRTPSRSTAASRSSPPPAARRLPVLRGGDLVAGQGPRLERAQLRRHPGRGRQQPRPELRPLEPRPGLEGTSLSGLWETPLVGHRPLGHLPLHDRLGVDDHRRLGRQQRHQQRRPSDDRRRAPERNGERQPDFYSLDLRVGKAFGVGLGVIAVFAECFNCSDEANRSCRRQPGLGQREPPNPSATQPNFGKETGFGTPRTFQFGVRFDF